MHSLKQFLSGLLWCCILSKPVQGTETREVGWQQPLNFCGEALPTKIPGVLQKMDYFLKHYRKRPRQLQVLRARYLFFRPYVLEQLQAHGLPEDLAYLPLVESAYRNARSPAGAAGVWQLMPATASAYGLRILPLQDERFLLRASTTAACLYLQKLHRQFGSWTLAAAAYNLGPASLGRCIARQRCRDYYRLRLNPETGEYIYRHIALKALLTSGRSRGNPCRRNR